MKSLVVLCLLGAVAYCSAAVTCPSIVGYVADPENHEQYYMCLFYKPIQRSCGAGNKYHQGTRTCRPTVDNRQDMPPIFTTRFPTAPPVVTTADPGVTDPEVTTTVDPEVSTVTEDQVNTGSTPITPPLVSTLDPNRPTPSVVTTTPALPTPPILTDEPPLPTPPVITDSTPAWPTPPLVTFTTEATITPAMSTTVANPGPPVSTTGPQGPPVSTTPGFPTPPIVSSTPGVPVVTTPNVPVSSTPGFPTPPIVSSTPGIPVVTTPNVPVSSTPGVPPISTTPGVPPISTTTQAPGCPLCPPIVCPATGIHRYIDPDYCHRFFLCQEGVFLHMTCPTGQVFDRPQMRCLENGQCSISSWIFG